MLSNKFFKIVIYLFIFEIASVGLCLANPFLKNKVGFSGNSRTDISGAKAVMIVLDASGSMSEVSRSGHTKMFAAKQVLEDVLSKVSPDVKVGLRVYGSTRATMSTDMLSKCQDSVLLVSAGTGNRATIINRLREIKPAGSTPIGFAMRRAANDLKRINVDKKAVVLISDGMDTCGYDPCKLARNLQAAGANVQFNVVGFGLAGDFDAIEQLRCIAKSTSGKFYTADTAAELSDSVLDGVNSYSLEVKARISDFEK